MHRPIGEIIRSLRKEREMTQEELAELLSVTQNNDIVGLENKNEARLPVSRSQEGELSLDRWKSDSEDSISQTERDVNPNTDNILPMAESDEGTAYSIDAGYARELDSWARRGRPVMTVLDLKPVERGLVIDDMQRVTSAYAKDRNPVRFVESSEVLYADEKEPSRCFGQ